MVAMVFVKLLIVQFYFPLIVINQVAYCMQEGDGFFPCVCVCVCVCVCCVCVVCVCVCVCVCVLCVFVCVSVCMYVCQL